MKHSLTYLLPFLILTVLGGCATEYVPPSSGPTAKVRIKLLSDSYFLIATAYLGGMCKDKRSWGLIGAEGTWVRKGYAETSSLNMLDGHATPDSKRKERLVAAERPLTLGLGALGGVAEKGELGSCNFAFTFTPKAGYEYEITHLQQDATCYLAVDLLTQEAGGTVKRTPVENVTREKSICL
jgi:hypothetical protein